MFLEVFEVGLFFLVDEHLFI